MMQIRTVAHATESLHDSDKHGQWHTPNARNLKDGQYEDENECRLSQ